MGEVMVIQIILFVILLFLILCLIPVTIFFTRKVKGVKKIHNLFEEIISERKIQNHKLIYPKEGPYDIYFETLTNVYYIRYVFNFSGSEICINNPYKWEIRSKMSAKTKYIEDLGDFLDFKPEETKKNVTKLFLVYPSSINILRYINECELNFVYQDTLIKGCNVWTFKDLEIDHSLLEAR